MTERDRMDNLHRAHRLRALAGILDEVQREFEVARMPLLSDMEDIRRRILALADRVEGLEGAD